MATQDVDMTDNDGKGKSFLPDEACCSSSLVPWSIIVPVSTVMNPHNSEAMLAASCPDQSCENRVSMLSVSFN